MHLEASANVDSASAPTFKTKGLFLSSIFTFELFVGQVAPFYPVLDSLATLREDTELHRPSQAHQCQLAL